MIEVVIESNQLTIDGHAEYAEHGQDIVCASVSALGQTLLNALINKGHCEGYIIRSGYIMLKWDFSKYSEYLVDAIIQGLYAIAEQYPEYVQIKEVESDERTEGRDY